MATCYAITEGEYSDYKVLAVFSTKELAERELPKYGTAQCPAEIEEFPFDPEVPAPPAGMAGFYCGTDFHGSVFANAKTPHEMAKMAKNGNIGDVRPAGLREKEYCVTLWARNEEHAIKIAAERFARQKAIDAGIAC
jgi:hypothetical protein